MAQVRLPRPRPVQPNRAETLAVVDIGSAKVCCLIARLKPVDNPEDHHGRSHLVEIIGYGFQRARGVKRGQVVDLDQGEKAVRLAVDHAERMAGVTVSRVIVGLGGGRIKSDRLSAQIRIAGQVSDGDVARVLDTAQDHGVEIDRTPLHAVPVSYAIDGEAGIADPRGMVGDELCVDMNLVTAQVAAIRNLVLLLERCHLGVDGIIATAYASGLAVLVADELELGSVAIDIGAGTTSIGVFANGTFIHGDAVAIGGHHVTMDLARGLSTSIDAAERIKTLYGSAIPTSADLRDTVSVPPIDARGGEEPTQVPRSFVTEIIKPRVEEILEVSRDRLRASGRFAETGRRAVLTGGASQLPGLGELAERILGCPIRFGRPIGVAGLPEAARGPGFAATVGLLAYPQAARENQLASTGRRRARQIGTEGYFARVGNWLRESF